jgi:histidine ammonia-lyase
MRELVEGSTLLDCDYHRVPRFAPWHAAAWPAAEAGTRHFDIAWDWLAPERRAGREAFYRDHLPFRGGKKHQPQDAYSLRCLPQVHGAVRDAVAQACRVIDIELNAVTDNPLVFPAGEGEAVAEQVVSAGHFHGMPLALAMSYVKAAIPVLASISERRLAKLVDPATSDGLPAFLVGNEDATDSGYMIVQYTAAALVNDLATRAHPASVYSIPTSANAEDHVSMGANEARHVLDMATDLGRVLALELQVAAQALDFRCAMLDAARALAQDGDGRALAAKVANSPAAGDAGRAAFEQDLRALAADLAAAPPFRPGAAVARARDLIRERVAFLARDRALDRDVQAMCALVESGVLVADRGG